jgi:23S rRNA (adenine2503-C2)-methyltransferase
MNALTDYDLSSLEAQLPRWGLKAAHAARLLRAYYDASGRIDYASLEARRYGRATLDKLAVELPPRQSEVRTRHASADGTVKLLIGFARGGAAEAVLMPSFREDRAAGCVSSQIGCAMRCDFCASTRSGLERDLEPGEIVEQYLHLRETAAAAGRRLTSLVFMGMGEPMHNLPNVIAAIRLIADARTGALGWRQITVSTVGVVAGIDALADANLNVHLAVSLHAPDDATRSRIVPMNRRWNVADIMAAARRFEQRTDRIPTIEYCMLEGVNDSDEQANLLADLMRGFRAHVNLIPYNSIGAGLSGIIYRRPDEERIQRFLGILRNAGVVAHVRRTRGDDVNAACGQLAGR